MLPALRYLIGTSADSDDFEIVCQQMQVHTNLEYNLGVYFYGPKTAKSQ